MAILSAFPGKSKPKLQEKTVTPSTSKQTVTPSSNYEGLSKVTVNAMSTATQATPSITVSSTGLITASATQSAGYVASGTKSSTKQLTAQAGTIITPGTSQQTAVATNRYTTGNVYVAGDSNLVSSNIKSGVSIFGVSGSLVVPYVGTATCNAEDDSLTFELNEIVGDDSIVLSPIPSANHKICMMYIWGPDINVSNKICAIFYDALSNGQIEVKINSSGKIFDDSLEASYFTLSRISTTQYKLSINDSTYSLRNSYKYKIFAVCRTDVVNPYGLTVV